jgi:hypothetical protein
MIPSDTGAWLLLFAGPLTRVGLPQRADTGFDAYSAHRHPNYLIRFLAK